MFLANNLNKGGSLGGYQISRSLRFNSADSAYLSRTYSNSATDLKKQTFSFWYKRTEFATTGFMFGGYDGSSANSFAIGFFTTGGIDNLRIQIDGTSSPNLLTTQVFRDPSAWYHIVIAIDTTQATSSNRLLLYVNGSQVTSFSTATYPALNSSSQFALTNSRNAVGSGYSGNAPMNGYMTEVNFIDGQALTPSSFGETNAQTGVWQPKAYAGSYGTNGFYLNFSDNSNTTAATLGKDYSGNGNNWIPFNFSVTAGAGNDSLVDSPTSYGTDTGVGGEVRGNYATMNPLQKGSFVTLTNGNLDSAVGASDGKVLATIGMSSGKWYAEVTGIVSAPTIGIATDASTLSSFTGGDAYSWGYYGGTGNKYTNGSSTAYGAPYDNTSTVGIAFDADAGTLTFYKNGTSQGTAYTGLTSGPYFFSNGNSSNTSCSWNFGQRPFAYTAPSGFKALCTQNLPTPTIGATTATQANKYFDVVLRNGGAPSGATYSTTVNMANGALMWDKIRSGTGSNALVNSVCGIDKFLYSNLTNAEVTQATRFTNFGTNSFSTGADDWSTSATVVDWIWAANGSGSTNTAGSITSTVSANTTSGFSVVTYTGTGANATVGHGLGVAPSMLIIKRRNDVVDWAVYHASLGATKYMNLNLTDAAYTASTPWNNTAPTSTVFSIGTAQSTNFSSSATYVAYCFAEVAGYSKFGSYTGNGSTDGPFVFTGLKPAFLLIKCSSAAENWAIYDVARDTYNVVYRELYPNSSSAETSGLTRDPPLSFDFLSNGFKLRGTNPQVNGNGNTYIYMALASNPFKYSLAR